MSISRTTARRLRDNCFTGDRRRRRRRDGAGGRPVRERQPPSTTAKPTARVEPSNRWLDGLKAKHRQFFDAPTPNGGIPLVHVMNYYDTYNKAFNVKDADIDAVLTFYGATTFYGLNDADVGEVQARRVPRDERPGDRQAGDRESVARLRRSFSA